MREKKQQVAVTWVERRAIKWTHDGVEQSDVNLTLNERNKSVPPGQCNG